MRSRWFIGLLFLILGAVVTTRIYGIIHRNDRATAQIGEVIVGTHVGEGDISSQVRVLDLINDKIKNAEAKSNYPVTLMVDITYGPDQIQQLASKVKAYGFFPIVRINQSCQNVGQERIDALISSVRNAFGADAVIAFGNELNHYGGNPKECPGKAWGQYETNFNYIDNTDGVAPSAIDWYVPENFTQAQQDEFELVPGSTVYNALRGIYDRAKIRTANGYGCVGLTKDTCNPSATNSFTQAFEGINGREFYLTEFSLSPGDDNQKQTKTSPDSSLANVLTFIQTYGTTTGARKVTPLVRNPGCSNVLGQWIYYIDGKLYSLGGQEITPENCGVEDDGKEDEDNDGLLSALLGRTKRKENDKTFWPTPEVTAAIQAKDHILAANAMVDDGYTAKCIAKFSVASIWGGAVDRWLELNKGKTLAVSDIENQESFSAVGGSVPFIRSNLEGVDQKVDVETFWSTAKGLNDDAFGKKIDQTPVFSRLTYGQQMYWQDKNLELRWGICDEYESTDCALWKQQPGTIHDISDTNSYLRESGLLNGSELALPYPVIADKLTISEGEFYALRERMSEVPLNFQQAVDINYILLIKELPKDNRGPLEKLFPAIFQRSKILNMLNPLDPKEIEADPYDNENDTFTRETVAAIAFPVPAFDINTGREHFYGEFAPWLYKRSLQTDWMNQADVAAEDARRDIEKAKVKKVQPIAYNSDKRNINAIGAAVFAPDGGFDTTTKALIDVSDDAAGACTGLVPDGADVMKYFTRYDDDPRYVTKTGFSYFSSIFTQYARGLISGLLHPSEVVTRFSSSDYLGEEARDIRPEEKTKPKIKLVLVTRYKQWPNPDWAEEITHSFMTQKQLEELEKGLTDTYLEAANVGEDPTAIDQVYKTRKIFDNVIPPRDDLALEDFYDFGSPVKTEPFYDEAECDTRIVNGTPVNFGDCMNELNVSIAGDGTGTGIPRQGRGLNALKMASLGFWRYKTPQQLHAANTSDLEEYFGGEIKQVEAGDSYTPGDYEPPGRTPAKNMCIDYEQQTTQIPDLQRMRGDVEAAALEYGLNPNMLWGIVNIEAGPFLRAQRAGKTTMSCKELINTCGAVGPMQIIQGVCTTDDCGAEITTIERLKDFRRDVNACDWEESLDWAARTLAGVMNDKNFTAGVPPEQLPYFTAGWYHGFSKETYLLKNKCEGAPPVSGCNNLNYCKCAVDGFVLDPKYNNM